MAFDEEYRELIEDAHDAMRKLFDESQPDSWPRLRIGYREVRQALDRDDSDTTGEGVVTGAEALNEIFDLIRRRLPSIPADDPVRPHLMLLAHKRCQPVGNGQSRAIEHAERRAEEEALERYHAWGKLHRDVKRGRILTVLGDDALTRDEIGRRLNERYPDLEIYAGGTKLVPALNDMLAAGELEREKEPRTPNTVVTSKGGYRWRWRRARTELTPELRDLERRLKGA